MPMSCCGFRTWRLKMRNCENASGIVCDRCNALIPSLVQTSMKNSLAFGLIAALLLGSVLSTLAGVQDGKTIKPNSQSDKSAAPSGQHPPLIGEMKVLTQGSQSSVQEPFVAVCRDDETYQALKKIDRALPKLDKGFFPSHVVLAAYLGMRNTGGYNVEITRKGNPNINSPSPDRTRFEVNEVVPPKDVMVTQVITAPFMIVS